MRTRVSRETRLRIRDIVMRGAVMSFANENDNRFIFCIGGMKYLSARLVLFHRVKACRARSREFNSITYDRHNIQSTISPRHSNFVNQSISAALVFV